MPPVTCRYCRTARGEIVLDLGAQPACDAFPAADDPGPDPRHPLRMWLCGNCGLAQLAEDPTTPEEPRGVEPAALVEQAADAVRRVADAGRLPARGTVFEYGSPHGGSWLPLLTARGLRRAGPDEPADVVLDCFGLMHAADQRAALQERVNRLASDGILLLQYHSLATIVRNGQWNAVRHGHFAYYSTAVLRRMLADSGLVARTAWTFELYGGTVLLAATRTGTANFDLLRVLRDEDTPGVRTRVAVRGLQAAADHTSGALVDWLRGEATAGRRVIGYGAASRAVALLCRAGIDADLLPAVADASVAKWGRRMPGTRIPVISPAELTERAPDAVLLFVPDLLDEVRPRFPAVRDWWVAEPVPHLARANSVAGHGRRA